MPPSTDAGIVNSMTLSCQETCSECWHLHPELENHAVVTLSIYERDK